MTNWRNQFLDNFSDSGYQLEGKMQMEALAKKKGKEGTRGAKQIAKENAESIQFYRNMILGANGIYFTGMTLLGANYYTTEIACFALCAVIYIAAYQFMARLGSPKYNNNTLIDPGLDLNMANGMAEHVKDAVILTSGVQMLSLISNYMWLLLLLAPLRAFWMAWTNIIAPWIFAPAPEEDEVDIKKQKKMERKMRRGGRY